MSASPVDGAKAPSDRPGYPGEKFGLPEEGPRSVAGMGRRVGALLIDWAICTLIAVALFHDQYWTLAVFAVQDYLLTALTGLTIGKRLCIGNGVLTTEDDEQAWARARISEGDKGGGAARAALTMIALKQQLHGVKR